MFPMLGVYGVAWLAALVAPPPHAGYASEVMARSFSRLTNPPLCCATPTQSDSWLLPVLIDGGLDTEQAEVVLAKQPPGRLPNAQKQGELLTWIRQRIGVHLAHLPPAMPAYLMLSKAPNLFLSAGSLPELDARLEAVTKLLGSMSTRQQATVITHTPDLLLHPADELRARADRIGEAASLSDRELRQAISSAPRLLLASPEALGARLDALQKRLRLDQGQLRRVVARAPVALQLKQKVNNKTEITQTHFTPCPFPTRCPRRVPSPPLTFTTFSNLCPIPSHCPLPKPCPHPSP